MLHAVTLSFEDHDVTLIVCQNRTLVRELHVRGQYQAPPFIAIRNDLEQKPCTVAVHGDVAVYDRIKKNMVNKQLGPNDECDSDLFCS